MATVVIFHEVEDVEHWLASTNRDKIFKANGITVTTLVEPTRTNRVGLLVDTPDMDTLERVIGSEDAAVAMSEDGVRAGTIVLFVES